VTNDGSVWTWGANTVENRAGHGALISWLDSPVRLPSLPPIRTCCCSARGMLLQTVAGGLIGVGMDAQGRTRLAPYVFDYLTSAEIYDMAAGSEHVFLLTSPVSLPVVHPKFVALFLIVEVLFVFCFQTRSSS
jgi:hypothetical protein